MPVHSSIHLLHVGENVHYSWTTWYIFYHILHTYACQHSLTTGMRTHPFLCPRHDNGWGIKCYPRPSIWTSIRHTHWRQIFLIRILWSLVTLFSTIMSFLSSIMVPSGVMAFCLWKFTIWNNVHSLSQILLIRILWNLVTLFSIMMSSSSWIMVHITPCLQELWPFVY